MKKQIALAVLFTLFLAAVLLAFPENEIVLIHANVVNTNSGMIDVDRTIVIKNNHIFDVAEQGKIAIPKDANVIDSTGKYIIPGLWDMHVHWYDSDYLPLFIANGVTGIRIMWGFPMHHQWRKQIEKGTMLGPHLSIASMIIDGPKPVWPGSIAVDNAASAREAVRRAQKEGADFIKVYSRLPRDAYFAIADECKKRHIVFCGHVPYSVSAGEASGAGQKSIEHLSGILMASSNSEQELRKELTKAVSDKKPEDLNVLREQAFTLVEEYNVQKASNLFAQFVKNGTWQCPTLTVHRSTAFMNDPDFKKDSRLKYMPRQIRMSWNPSYDFGLWNRTPEESENLKKEFEKMVEIVRSMNQAGVRFLAGTDTLNPYCFPGFSLHDELGLLVQAGLTPAQALQAATRNAAEYSGKLDSFGSVEKGKIADVVLLNENPLKDIRNTEKIFAVIYGGKVYDRAALDKMLSNMEQLASRKSVAEALRKTINDQGIDAAVQQFHELRKKKGKDYEFNEMDLNMLGYQFIGMEKFKVAIEIFKLNVEMYPQSWKVYDSLADAYLKNGDAPLAVKNYAKSLKLNPQNSRAQKMLRKLKEHNNP